MLFHLGKGECLAGKLRYYSRQQSTAVEWIAAARRLGVPYAVIQQRLTPLTRHRMTEKHIAYIKRRWFRLQQDWSILSSYVRDVKVATRR